MNLNILNTSKKADNLSKKLKEVEELSANLKGYISFPIEILRPTSTDEYEYQSLSIDGFLLLLRTADELLNGNKLSITQYGPDSPYSDPGQPHLVDKLKKDVDYLKGDQKNNILSKISDSEKIIAHPEESEAHKNARKLDVEYFRKIISLIDSVNYDFIDPILDAAQKKLAMRLLQRKNLEQFKLIGKLDGQHGVRMNPYIVRAAGTPSDAFAKAYTEGYVPAREKKLGGKSRKNSKKARKTRRVKKVNGRK
jgi:hypothetical protein